MWMVKAKLKNYLLVFRILISEFFWTIRVNLCIILLFFNKKIVFSLNNLKTSGVYVISNFVNKDKIKKINDECLKSLDNVIDYNKKDIERINGSIKIKELGKKNKYIKKLQHNFFLKFLALVYMFKIKSLKNGALMILNVTHDGSFPHPSIPGVFKGKMIAGDPHLDTALHSLKAFLALEDITEDNGPFISLKGSGFSKDLIPNYVGMLSSKNNAHLINEDQIKKINLKNKKKYYKGIVKQGDLVLIDTRNIHYASSLLKGSRKVLWYYY